MVQLVAEIFMVMYLMLPAYFSNMSPVIFGKVNFLNYPVDFGKKISGKRIFGKNKTFRGFFFGVVSAIITAFIQFLLNIKNINLVSYDNFLLIGFLLGFGALLGDLIESFVKRRIGIKSGNLFFPFDYIDHTLGALILVSIIVIVPFWPALWVVLLTIPAQLLVNYAGFRLKLRKNLF